MALKTKKVGNYIVKVDFDEYSKSPRKWDYLSVIYSAHRHYSPDNRNIEELLDEDDNLKMDGQIGLLVWMFEHSGCTFKTAEFGEGNPFGDGLYASFDSGCFGVIAMPIEKAKKEFGEDWEERAKDWMRDAIETYSQWCQGMVFRWEIEDNDGCDVDSVGDYYDEDEALNEGIAEAEAYNENDKKEIEKFLKDGTLDELKNKFYEMATEAPIWVDEVFELVDEDKAKEWLRGKLKKFLKVADCGEEWEEVE